MPWKVRHTLMAGAPDLLLAAGHLTLFVGLVGGAPWARTAAEIAAYWPASELLAVVVAPFLLWIFLPRDPTPIYQRVMAVPFVIVGLIGLSGLVQFLRLFWLYVLAKCVRLAVERPSIAQHNAGLVRSAMALPALLFVGSAFLNKPYEPAFRLMEAGQFDAQARYLGNMMLFGAVYFVLVGLAAGVWSWMATQGPGGEAA